MRVLHHNVCETFTGWADALVRISASREMGRLLTESDGARGESMTVRPRTTSHLLALVYAALILVCPTLVHAMPVGGGGPPAPPLPGDDTGGDDLFLLRSAVSPNVILFLDNSQSMNHIEWHPDFNPDFDPDNDPAGDVDTVYCTESADFGGVLDPEMEYIVTGDMTNVSCDTPSQNTRTVYGPENPTYWSGRYLMWYLGLDTSVTAEGDILVEIDTKVADVEGCTQAGGSGAYAEMYRRTRFEATKQVLLDLLCLAEPKNVRFGSAAFRDADDALGVDPNGGYISEDLGRSNPNHAAELEASLTLESVNSTDGTPLAETLFQIYTYWMPRVLADMPIGRNGNQFPIYEYSKFGAQVGSVLWLEDTMLYDCEKAFVIIVTDGLPSQDTFLTDPASTSLGYSDFGTGVATGLIGDYYVDGEDEEPASGAADGVTYYLDDIAKYMYDTDFRPDLDGDQTIDTYVVGFATGKEDNVTNDFLGRVAELGNGIFNKAQD
jgi:hypothetical protein